MLHEILRTTKARFILSTWHSNQHRENPTIQTLWSKFNVITREHFYHVGANEENRKPMLEALIINFETVTNDQTTNSYDPYHNKNDSTQLTLFER